MCKCIYISSCWRLLFWTHCTITALLSVTFHLYFPLKCADRYFVFHYNIHGSQTNRNEEIRYFCSNSLAHTMLCSHIRILGSCHVLLPMTVSECKTTVLPLPCSTALRCAFVHLLDHEFLADIKLHPPKETFGINPWVVTTSSTLNTG